MKKKVLKITESQLKIITKLINEDQVNNKIIIKQVANYIKKYYEPSFGTYKETGEYHNSPMVMNKIDNELIDPKGLLRHLTNRFNLDPEFLSQIVRDWYDGKLENGFTLSQNISPTV